jgi:hypothetical protein
MRVRNRLALVAAGAVCLIATVYLTVTRENAVEARVRALLADELRAPCSFEAAEFSFLDGLTIRDLIVLDPEDPLRPPLVVVKEARVDFHLDLLGSGPRLTVVHLKQPRIRVTADSAGQPTLLAVLPEADPDAPAPDLPVIRIVDGTVDLEGPPALQPGETATATSIRADVIATSEGVRVPDGHARLGGLGRLEFTLHTVQEARTIDLTVRAPEVDVASFLAETHIDRLREALEPLDPAGQVDLDASLRLLDGVVTDVSATVDVVDAAATVGIPDKEGLPDPEPFVLTLNQASLRLRDGRLTVESAEGRALGAPLSIQGYADVGKLLSLPPPPGGAAIDVTVQLRGGHVGPAIRPHFPKHLRRIRDAFALEGITDAEVYVRGKLPDPAVDATLDIRDVRAGYAGYLDEATGRRRGFPWYAEGIVGQVRIAGPRVELEGRGRHGPAAVSIEGYHVATPQGPRTEIRVVAENVPVDEDLWAAFQDRAEATLGPWQPSGFAERVEVLVEENPAVASGDAGTQVTVHLDGRTTFVPHVLPAPLREVRGIVRILEPADGDRRISRVELEGLSARGDGFTLTAADGHVVGKDEHLKVQVDVEQIAGPFHDALQESSTLTDGTKRAFRLLAPRGSALVDVQIESSGGARDDVVTARLRGADVQGWEGVPLAVRALEGVIRYEDGELSTTGLTGEALAGASVQVTGSLSELDRSDPRISLDLEAVDVPLDTRLRDALGTLAEPASTVWDELPGDPDLRAEATVRVRPEGAPEGRLAFRLRNLRGGVRVLGLPLRLREGEAEFASSSGIVKGSLRAERGSGELSVDEFVFDTGSEDLDAGLTARGLAFPEDLVPLISPEAAATIEETLAPSLLHLPELALSWNGADRRLTLRGSAAVRVTSAGIEQDGLHVRSAVDLQEVVLHLPPDAPVKVEGRATVRETSLDPGIELTELQGPVGFRGVLGGDPSSFEIELSGGSGRIIGLLLDDLSFRLEQEGSRMWLRPVTATFYGGSFEGEFVRGGPRLDYRGSFSVEDADFAEYSDDQERDAMAGRLNAKVRFRRPPGPDAQLEGTGEAQLTGAEILVPWVSASLRAIDDALFGIAAIEGHFHEGTLSFDLRGQRALIRELHFEGPSVPLLLGATLELQDGNGAIDLVEGRMDLIVYPRLRLGLFGIDPTGILDRIVGLAQFMVRRLRIEGTTRNPRTRWEVIPTDIEDEFARRPRPIGEVRPYGPAPW